MASLSRSGTLTKKRTISTCEDCGAPVSEMALKCADCSNASRGIKNRDRNYASFKKWNNLSDDAPNLCDSCEFNQGIKKMRGERTAVMCRWCGNISCATFKCSSYLKKE